LSKITDEDLTRKKNYFKSYKILESRKIRKENITSVEESIKKEEEIQDHTIIPKDTNNEPFVKFKDHYD
jgi:hypothetical protein